jgi:hypothetical protein
MFGPETVRSEDFADTGDRNAWLHHPVYGDPSFDSFQRASCNPIHRGAPPFEWPVNGFLFEDPASGDWFIYAGLYAKGYAMGPDKGMTCVACRSSDQGRSWRPTGPVFPEEPFCFTGDAWPVTYAPDVSVVYDSGRYHMVYDWATSNSTWATMMAPKDGADNGIGHAWADKPEGPFIRSATPVYRTSAHPLYRGKYRRAYAATLIRRESDWLVLAMMDSGAHFGWAMVGMTSENPEGPYSEPVFLRSVDEDSYHPPLLEFYPAFPHEGFLYAPATSVAVNRNFQVLFRAPLEEADQPESWEIAQEGSLWHGEPVPHEHAGIWGQTFSGFVGKDGMFRVMFPSLDAEGLGSLNLASRPWNKPFRERGFVFTGHRGPSLTLLKQSYRTFHLHAELTHQGEAALLWDYQGALGPDRPASDATLHALTLAGYSALELSGDAWRVVRVDSGGARTVIASGEHQPDKSAEVELRREADGRMMLSLEGKEVWREEAGMGEGPLGLLAQKESRLEVLRFEVEGDRSPATLRYLFTEGILGAGASEQWRTQEDPRFRYRLGGLSANPHARAKWNVTGSGVSLWAPKGPEFGNAELLVDGVSMGLFSLHAEKAEESGILFQRNGFKSEPHAVVLKVVEGVVPLDCLEVQVP